MEIGDNKREEDIVIVGGGICGLATALALHRKGIRSVVLERSKALRGTGAAIILHANGWRALEQLGVASILRQTALPILSGQINLLNNGEIKEMEIGKEELRCLKRSDLMSVLADNLPHETVRFGCEVLSLNLDSPTSSPILQLQDGTALKAKVVIGCDGVNSVISNKIGVGAANIFSICVIRGFTSYANGHQFGNQMSVTRKDDTQLGILPITKTLLYWFITRKPNPQDSVGSQSQSQSQKLTRNLGAEAMEGFPANMVDMLKNSELDSLHLAEYLRYQAPWDLLRRRFRVGKVTVAGDAMHAMGPFLAQGGSAALEDAVVLARCLAHKAQTDPSGTGTEEALDEYLKERKMRLLRLSLQTYLIGKMFHTSSHSVKFICIFLMATLFRDSHGHTRFDCGSL